MATQACGSEETVPTAYEELSILLHWFGQRLRLFFIEINLCILTFIIFCVHNMLTQEKLNRISQTSWNLVLMYIIPLAWYQ